VDLFSLMEGVAVTLSAIMKTLPVSTAHPPSPHIRPTAQPTPATTTSTLQLAGWARELTQRLSVLPAQDRVRALAELGAALHEAVAGPLILAVGEAVEEGLDTERVRLVAGRGYPFLRSALGLVG
jgi:hypothetical protein